MTAAARIEINKKNTGEWETLAEFANTGSAYDAVNAIGYGPSIERVRITVRRGRDWTCEYNRLAKYILAERVVKGD